MAEGYGVKGDCNIMKIKCKVCGCEFDAVAERHYISRDNSQTGAVAAFSSSEVKLYDTFDCVNCGCQVVVQERHRRFGANVAK